jgi:hypothetical protein
MTEEQRLDMIKKFQPPSAEPEAAVDAAEPEEEPEDPKITKFKSAFFKINNRSPTEEEINKVREELFDGDSNV